jgi:hypothetical protein
MKIIQVDNNKNINYRIYQIFLSHKHINNVCNNKK